MGAAARQLARVLSRRADRPTLTSTAVHMRARLLRDGNHKLEHCSSKAARVRGQRRVEGVVALDGTPPAAAPSARSRPAAPPPFAAPTSGDITELLSALHTLKWCQPAHSSLQAHFSLQQRPCTRMACRCLPGQHPSVMRSSRAAAAAPARRTSLPARVPGLASSSGVHCLPASTRSKASIRAAAAGRVMAARSTAAAARAARHPARQVAASAASPSDALPEPEGAKQQ